MMDFVCCRCRSFELEWEHQLDESSWRPLLDDIQDTTEETTWVAEAVLSILEAQSEFARRVVRQVTTFPLLILWLAFSPPGQKCEHRRKCSQDLLSMSKLHLMAQGGLALKFRYIFRCDIEAAACTGVINEKLHGFVLALGAAWTRCMETQEIEGVNGIIKHIIRLALAISFPLLSSRITH